jgi:AcrR family transcriptional regulator
MAGIKNMNIVEKTKGKYLDYEKREQEILNVAIRLFNEKGYKATTTAEIAKEASISEPTMYKHFENKAALFMECFSSIVNELIGMYRKVYRETKDDEMAYLKGVTMTYVDFVIENPGKSKFLVHLLSYKDDPEFDDAFKGFMEKSVDTIAGIIKAARKKGMVHIKIDERFLAAWFVSQYFTVVSLMEIIKDKKLIRDNLFYLVKAVLGTK